MSYSAPRRQRTVGRWVGAALKRTVVTILGVGVMLLGVIMWFTPGPGWGAVIAGLAILATEYDWASRLLERVKERSRAAYQGMKARLGTRRHTDEGEPGE